MSKKCASCAFENTDDAEFCESCGLKLDGSPVPRVPTPPAGSRGASARPRPSAPPAPTSRGGKLKCALCGSENEAGSEFCDSCGAKLSAAAQIQATTPAMPTSKLILPQGDEIAITSYPRAFGRADFARIEKSEYVSRKHFEVSMENGKYYLADTGSTNGTSLNKTKLTSKSELKDGDQIELGGVITLTFKAG